MNDIKKIIQALENSNILPKRVTKTIKNETKEQKGGFLSMLFLSMYGFYGTLGASLLGNLSTGKGIVKAATGNRNRKGNKKGKGIVTAGTGKEWNF